MSFANNRIVWKWERKPFLQGKEKPPTQNISQRKEMGGEQRPSLKPTACFRGTVKNSKTGRERKKKTPSSFQKKHLLVKDSL